MKVRAGEAFITKHQTLAFGEHGIALSNMLPAGCVLITVSPGTWVHYYSSGWTQEKSRDESDLRYMKVLVADNLVAYVAYVMYADNTFNYDRLAEAP